MMPSWLGMALVLVAFGLATVGLRVYRRRRSPDPELLRKLLHVAMGLVTLAFPWMFRSAWPVLLLAIGFVVWLGALRWSAALRRRFGGITDGVSRESQGEIFFPLGIASVFVLSGGEALLFSIPVLLLTLADTAAALVGCRYGRHRFRACDGEKSVEGCLAFFAMACLCTYAPLLATEIGQTERLLIALTLALAATLLEAISTRGLDNLVIPLGIGILLKAALELDAGALVAQLVATVILVALFAGPTRP